MAERNRQSTVGSDQSLADRQRPIADRQLAAADRQLPTADRRLPTDIHRVVIEHLSPEIDAGRFPIKRTRGEQVEVSADVFADGHDVLTVLLRDRHLADDGETAERVEWRETPMTMTTPGTDRWIGWFAVEELGWHEYQVVGSVDRFRSWRRDLEVKGAAGQDAANLQARQEYLTQLAAQRCARGNRHPPHA